MARDGEMKTRQIKSRLLKLLMKKPPLDSTDAWAQALSQVEAEHGFGPQSEEFNLLQDVIQELVPHLPEYKTVRIPLLALLEYCQNQYPVETDSMAQIWLKRSFAVTSMTFRRWLVEWLYGNATARTETNQSTWIQALQTAVASTEIKDLEIKLMLLQMLHRLKDTGEDPLERAAQDVAVTQTQEAITTAEELLDFYWHHANTLATSALLCAAKLSALLDTTADHRNLKPTVSVRLRWALMTKPLLFESLLHHATTLKAFRSSTDSIKDLRLSAELQAFMDCVGPLQLIRLQDQYERTIATLRSAYQLGVKHLYQQQDTAPFKLLHDAALQKLLTQWTSQTKERLVADLVKDLALAPRYLVPAVFAPLSVYLRTLVRSEDTEERDHGAQEALVIAMNALFKLLKRASDATICYLVLAIVFESKIAQHHVWRRKPSFFASVIQLLSECLALENDRERNWIVAMTLQQLLFECDTDVLRMNHSQISGFVPQKLERLIHVRLQ